MDSFKVSDAPLAPLPTVVPGNTPQYQVATDVGTRTLWWECSSKSIRSCYLYTHIFLRVVFVLMVISSIAFYALAYRQPVVGT